MVGMRRSSLVLCALTVLARHTVAQGNGPDTDGVVGSNGGKEEGGRYFINHLIFSHSSNQFANLALTNNTLSSELDFASAYASALHCHTCAPSNVHSGTRVSDL